MRYNVSVPCYPPSLTGWKKPAKARRNAQGQTQSQTTDQEPHRRSSRGRADPRHPRPESHSRHRLGGLYQVETFNLNKAVKRNPERFPEEFMFQLTQEETADLRFQSGMSSWGGRRTLPYAFTEHGVAMLSSVLRSPRAVQVKVC